MKTPLTHRILLALGPQKSPVTGLEGAFLAHVSWVAAWATLVSQENQVIWETKEEGSSEASTCPGDVPP